MTHESTDLHPSHDWDSDGTEGTVFCHKCHVCFCHVPEESASECEGGLGL